VYIHGKFVGGSDILAELAARGELEGMIRNP
jgi:glutaredoxin-related protein